MLSPGSQGWAGLKFVPQPGENGPVTSAPHPHPWEGAERGGCSQRLLLQPRTCWRPSGPPGGRGGGWRLDCICGQLPFLVGRGSLLMH